MEGHSISVRDLEVILDVLGRRADSERLARDEHLRLSLYTDALEAVHPDREREILSIVLADPDPVMGASAVLAYVDRVAERSSLASGRLRTQNDRPGR
jgi:hypothetical protein